MQLASLPRHCARPEPPVGSRTERHGYFSRRDRGGCPAHAVSAQVCAEGGGGDIAAAPRMWCRYGEKDKTVEAGTQPGTKRTTTSNSRWLSCRMGRSHRPPNRPRRRVVRSAPNDPAARPREERGRVGRYRCRPARRRYFRPSSLPIATQSRGVQPGRDFIGTDPRSRRHVVRLHEAEFWCTGLDGGVLIVLVQMAAIPFIHPGVGVARIIGDHQHRHAAND
jgi:hypothetical protein